jgi:hypothetical protein
MRILLARGLAPILLWLLSFGSGPAQPAPYLLVRTFTTTAAKPPGTLGLKGVIQNECQTTFGASTYFEITYNGQPFDIPIAGLPNGKALAFNVAETVSTTPQTPAAFTFAIILPDKVHTYHNVSPCTPVFTAP